MSQRKHVRAQYLFAVLVVHVHSSHNVDTYTHFMSFYLFKCKRNIIGVYVFHVTRIPMRSCAKMCVCVQRCCNRHLNHTQNSHKKLTKGKSSVPQSFHSFSVFDSIHTTHTNFLNRIYKRIPLPISIESDLILYSRSFCTFKYIFFPFKLKIIILKWIQTYAHF